MRDTDDSPRSEPGPVDDALEAIWTAPPGIWGRLQAVQNDIVGTRLIFTGLFFLLLGGSVDSLVMRLQLARPENDLVGPQLYNELFTNHGSVTMFLVILPIFEGFAILILPLMLGTREMPFPRLGSFAYFTFLLGGLLYYSSTLFSAVPDAGWFGYTPLSGPEFSPDIALDFWVLGLGVAEVGAIAAAVEIIIAVMKMRAPGMTLTRIPLFAWALLVTAFMILFAFTPLIVGSLLLELDRGFGTQFFNPDAGGSSLLWQHLFWIFGHPEVYIQFLPATGIVSMILPVFCRRRIVAYPWLVASLIGIGFLSFGLWAHHMFTVGLPPLVLAFFSAASMVIAIPAGVQFFAWLATIWTGRPRWDPPLLFVVGFLVLFLLGGITGVMVAAVPFDSQAHDSYFVVAHLHYVLLGGVVFPIFAGIYYWYPKYTGRLLDASLGRAHFWLLFAGVNVTFFPMHIVGLMGMPRRISTYPAGLGWGIYNLISTVGVFIMASGVAIFGFNLWRSRKHGEPAGENPWDADTLEWATASPPPQHGFSVPVIVRSRHPLWDQDDLHSGDAQVEGIAEALATWPLTWRATMTVSTAEARPEAIIRLAGPSIWPLVAALGTVGIFVAELLHLRPLIFVSLTVVVGALVRWNWPEPIDLTEEEEDAFEREHGIPVGISGSPAIARWGMGLGLLFAGVAFSSFLLSYFYLRLENPTWPPEGTDAPSVLTGTLAVAAIIVGAVLVRRAQRRIEVNDTLGMRTLLGIGTLAGTGAAVVLWRSLLDGDLDPTEHAYGSIVFALAGYLVVLVAAGIVMSVMTIWWSRGEGYTSRRHGPVVNTARYWTAMSVMWTVGSATLHLGPVLA